TPFHRSFTALIHHSLDIPFPLLPSFFLHLTCFDMEVESFQDLAYNGGTTQQLPPQFIRPSHERPENTKAIEGVTVPVVSLSQPHEVLVDQVSKACMEWGFVMVTNHGISSTLIQRLKEVGEGFFALPLKEKQAYANDAANGKFEGYGTRMIKNPDEKTEWLDYFFHLAAPPAKVNPQIWPKHPPSYRRSDRRVQQRDSEADRQDPRIAIRRIGAGTKHVEIKLRRRRHRSRDENQPLPTLPAT
ncbi:unnamed protein product, partial [Linum tenue]